MSDDLHNIDDLFKKGLEDHAENPPLSVWDNIDKSLDEKKVVSILKKYNKLKWAAAILLLFSGALAMYALHVSKKNTELVKQNHEKKFSKNQELHVTDNAMDSGIITKNNIFLSKNHTTKTSGQADDANASSLTRNNGVLLSHDNNTTSNLNSVVSKNSLPGKELTATFNKNTVHKNEISFNHNTNNTAYSKPAKTKSSVIFSTKSMVNNNQKEKEILNVQEPVTGINDVAAEDYLNNKEKNRNLPLNNDHENTSKEKLNNESSNVYNINTRKEKRIESGRLARAFADASEVTFTEPALKSSDVLNSKFIVSKKSGARNAKSYHIKNSTSPLSATLFFSHDWVSTSLRNEDIRFNEEDRREIGKNERNNFSSTLGVMIDYKISKKLSLQSGVTFFSWITHNHPRTIYARPDDQGNINYRFNCAAGYSYFALNSAPAPVSGDSLKAFGSDNTLQYISVPFMVRYNMGGRRFNVVPGVGFSANFLTKGQIKTTIATNIGDVKASSNSIEGLKPLYFSGLANIAFQYNFNKSVSFALIPTARFSLSSINKNAPVKTNLYSLGFAGAVVIRL